MAELPDAKSTRGYIETRAAIQSYAAVLEATAKEFEKDRTQGARSAIAATVTFLIALRLPRRLTAPLVEAAEIVQREMGVKGAISKDVAEKVIQSIAVSLQLECGVSELKALRNVAGSDSKATTRLRNFRGNMMNKDSPKGAKDFYFRILRTDFKDLSPEQAMNKALTVCARMGGKKS